MNLNLFFAELNIFFVLAGDVRVGVGVCVECMSGCVGVCVGVCAQEVICDMQRVQREPLYGFSLFYIFDNVELLYLYACLLTCLLSCYFCMQIQTRLMFLLILNIINIFSCYQRHCQVLVLFMFNLQKSWNVLAAHV